MSDNNPHHPGVRSLLAKFENQSPVASPPSRGRSPAASDSSGTARQLSKVRASFITVDGVVQSNPASPLRKTSGRSDSSGIFGPKITSEETESGRQTMVSPTPLSRLEHPQNATLGQIMADGRPEQDKEIKGEPDQTLKTTTATNTDTEPKAEPSLEKTETNVSTGSKSERSDTLSHNSDSSATAKKKPSSLGPARNVASKPKSTAAPSAAKPATSTNPKPSARELAKERSNALAHKPSRVSLNPKTTARSTRGATPAQDASKPSATSASTRPRVKSPVRPARATGSTAPQTQSSTGKLGSTGAPSARTTATSTLHRKPSTLKSAVGSQRATTPTASVRRQASRPSLPSQSANDTHTKPVNEGFLARMMRPTASSANKLQAQEKADAKPTAKTTTAHKAPRPSIGRVAERGTSDTKPNSTTLRPALNKGSVAQKNTSKPPQKKQESEKENEVQPIPISPKESAPVKPAQATVEEQPEAVAKPIEETASLVQVDEAAVEPTPAPASESNEKSVEIPEPIIEEAPVETSTPAVEASEIPVKTEPAVQPIPEAAEEKVEQVAVSNDVTESEAPAEEPVKSSESAENVHSETLEEQETIAAEPELAQSSKSADLPAEVSEKTEATSEPAQQPTEKTTEAVIAEAKPTEEAPAEVESKESAPAVQPSPEAESSNVALDITNLALN
ncbi:hypothetical protein MYU51_018081 [Penicillium brevicompactum]|uniref:uncharacterized protein n=1 Tax=Penicillium brevicompactum TaxID=5074 RepID=UPI002541FFC2|nr:uncharacterized protein N7506_010542 [Penicillium brevicompactum]KAJ5327440.1 hypothetical protein N7506_010542 [Penicillium brevicompactum]